MRDYNRNDRSGRGRRGGGGSRGFGGRDSGRREMFSAVCDECGNNCEVPFRPSGDKPIYCSSCFEKRNGGDDRRPERRGRDRSGGGRPDDTSKKLLEQMRSLNEKMDRLLAVIETGGKKKVKPSPKKAKAEKKTEESPAVEMPEAKEVKEIEAEQVVEDKTPEEVKIDSEK